MVIFISMQTPSTNNNNEPIFIVVLGATGTGKTTFVNLASNSGLQVGMALSSCTNEVQVSVPFKVGGRRVVLLDTPGFDDTNKSDIETMQIILRFLAEMYRRGKMLAGILYFHRISDVRMGGTSNRNFEVFRHLCGPSALKNAVIVTTMWGEVDQEKGESREEQLKSKYFAPAIRAGAKLLRHSNTANSAESILRQVVNNQPLPFRIQQEIVDERLKLVDTAAGQVLNQDLREQEQKFQREKEELIREMESTKKEAKKGLLEEIKAREADVAQIQGDLIKLRPVDENGGGWLHALMRIVEIAAVVALAIL